MRAQHYEVSLLIGAWHDSEITANVVAGLALLSAAKRIRLRMVVSDRQCLAPHVMGLNVIRCSDGVQRTAIVEVLDRADVFDHDSLAAADVYFKCNYQTAHVSRLDIPRRCRVVPLGLTLLSAVGNSRAMMLRAIGCSFLARMRAGQLKAVRHELGYIAKELILLHDMVRLAEFETDVDVHPRHPVIFQPRLWSESTMDKANANALRVELVRELRAEFGGNERIGFIHSSHAQRLPADVKLKNSVSRRRYIHQLRESAIGVNTRGLSDSSTFKLSEYLAAGMAVVSDAMNFDLPEPLVAGVNYLPYSNAAECVAQCKLLLAEPDRLMAMRKANREYFRRNLEPRAQADYLLGEIFSGV